MQKFTKLKYLAMESPVPAAFKINQNIHKNLFPKFAFPSIFLWIAKFHEFTLLCRQYNSMSHQA